jgi:hypothetical protein
LYERLDVTGRFPCRCKFFAAAFEFCPVFYFTDDPNTKLTFLSLMNCRRHYVFGAIFLGALRQVLCPHCCKCQLSKVDSCDFPYAAER